MELLSPTVGFAFHRIMTQSGNEPVLLDLLNAVLLSSGDQKADWVEVKNPSLEAETVGDKDSVLDVHARLADGRPVNVEMQVANEGDWPARSLYYWSRLYALQLQASMQYERLQPAIAVGILNFHLWPTGPFHQTYRLRADHDPTAQWNDHLALHTVELPKLPATVRPAEVPLVRWVKFLMEGPLTMKEDVAKESPAIQQALDTLKALSYDEVFRSQYEMREKGRRDRASALAYARKQGREEGREEALVATARRLLVRGLSSQEVADATGLPVETIALIAQSHQTP